MGIWLPLFWTGFSLLSALDDTQYHLGAKGRYAQFSIKSILFYCALFNYASQMAEFFTNSNSVATLCSSVLSTSVSHQLRRYLVLFN